MTSLTTTSTSKMELMLTPKQEKALEFLPDQERKMIEAALLPCIRKVPEEIGVDSLLQVIGTVHVIAGTRAEMPQMISLSQLVYRRLMQELPMITMQEVEQALENGVYGQYGEYYGLYARTFVKWCKDYLADPGRKEAKENFSRAKKLKAPVDPPPPYWLDEYWTPEMVEEWKVEAEKYFQYFRSGNILVRATTQGVYWILRRLRKIEMNQEYMDRLIDQARTVCRRELLSRTDPDKERLLKELELYTSSMIRTKINLEAKRFAVFEFFSSIGEQDNILW